MYNLVGDDIEQLEYYVPGGYHPVLVDDVLHDRYRVILKLGYGGYSTIWLAEDKVTSQYLALKVGVAAPYSVQQESGRLYELSELQPPASLKDISAFTNHCFPRIMDDFCVEGPNGTHACLTMEVAQGSLFDDQSAFAFPINVARAMCARLVIALAMLHHHGLVHGGKIVVHRAARSSNVMEDIRLRNILVAFSPPLDTPQVARLLEKYGRRCAIPVTRIDSQPLTTNCPANAYIPVYLGKYWCDFDLVDARSIMLGDFGESFSPSRTPRLGKDCNIPLMMMAPEAHFEPEQPISFPSDIWSLAYALWQILGLFGVFNEPGLSGGGRMDESSRLIAEQINLFGYEDFPTAWKAQWERPMSPASDQELSPERPRRPTSSPQDEDEQLTLEETFEEFVQSHRVRNPHLGLFDQRETTAILSLMRQMFRFDPKERLSVDGVLQSEWMVHWALPALHGS